MKENCSEFRNFTKTECPVQTEERLDCAHGGSNARRACWALSSTHCTGFQGACLDKKSYCDACVFYQKVTREEGHRVKSREELSEILCRKVYPDVL